MLLTEALHETRPVELLQEARLAATPVHPNICTTTRSQGRRTVYLVMELIGGVPLSQKIAECGSGLPIESVVRYGMQIAAVLRMPTSGM